MQLTVSQIDQFAEEGYLVVENALDDSDLNPVIREYEEYTGVLAEAWLEQGMIHSLYEEEKFETRLARMCEENLDLAAQSNNLFDLYRARGRHTFDFLRNENLMDLVEGLVGPEIICSPIQHLRAKLPSRLFPTNGGGSHVAAWHQDAGVTMDDADPHFILTVWIPLTKATRENGCMQIIPRVHEGRLLNHQIVPGVGTRIRADEMPDAEPVDLPIDKGGVVLIHKNIPHRSTPNNSNGIRWSMDLRYQKTGTSTGRTIYPDFVVRSRENPGSVLSDHQEWCRMWVAALAAESPADKHHRWETVQVESS